MAKTLIMLVGNADSSFVLNELPYICNVFDAVHIFAYNTRNASQVKCKLPDKVYVHHVNVCKGWRRLLKYIPKGLRRTVPALKINTLRPKRVLASLYVRGRAESVYRFVLSTIESDKIDCSEGVVYSYWFTDQAIVAWRLKEWLNAQRGDFKSYSRAHGYDLYWERNGAGYLPYQDVSLEHLDGVFPCSDFGVRYLRNKYPAFEEKIHVARLGTKDCGLGPFPNGERVSFVTCSRLSVEKRVPLFAEAFCTLVKRYPNCHWYCIGDGEERGMIEDIIKRKDAEAVITMMGMMSNKIIMEFYRATPIDYFVNVSSSEGVPVSIMEAMSFGIPIVATDVGGTGELVNATVGKLLKSDISADELTDVLSDMINVGSEQYRNMRLSARAGWEDFASADKNYKAWCERLSVR